MRTFSLEATNREALETSDIRMSDVAMHDLRGASAPKKVRFGATGKIIGAVIVLALVGAVGTYAYKTMPPPHPKQAVSSNELPVMPSTGR